MQNQCCHFIFQMFQDWNSINHIYYAHKLVHCEICDWDSSLWLSLIQIFKFWECLLELQIFFSTFYFLFFFSWKFCFTYESVWGICYVEGLNESRKCVLYILTLVKMSSNLLVMSSLLKGTSHPIMEIRSLSTHLMLMQNWVKFCNPQNISVLLEQKHPKATIKNNHTARPIQVFRGPEIPNWIMLMLFTSSVFLFRWNPHCSC